MGNPNSDDEEMTPEELVLEAAASSALDIDHEKKGKKKKAAEDEEEEDVDEILASVPTELERGDNVQRTTPGAFREGDDDNAQDDDIRTTASSSHRSESFRQSKLLVEATLVHPADGTTVPGETNNETPATAANGGEEVYKAEPVTDASTGSGDRRWFWRGILVGTFISILIVGGAIVALVLLAPWDSRDSSSDLKNAATETPAPGSPSTRQRTLDDYDRITDHVAFVGLWVDDDHCEFDNNIGKGELAQIELKCGDFSPEGDDNESSSDDDDIQKPLLEIRDEGGSDCRRRKGKRHEYFCDIFNETERIVFSCGTDAKEYRTGSQNTTAKATASAHLERMKATCDSGGGGGGGGGNGYQGGSGGDRDRNRGRKTGGLRRRARDGSQEGRGPPPIMLAIIAIGRLCHPEDPGMSYFKPSGVCLPSASFINESSFLCYNEQYEPCGGSGSLCLGNFAAFDSFVGDTNCESEDVENSFWATRPDDFESELDEEFLLHLIRPGLNGTEN